MPSLLVRNVGRVGPYSFFFLLYAFPTFFFLVALSAIDMERRCRLTAFTRVGWKARVASDMGGQVSVITARRRETIQTQSAHPKGASLRKEEEK